MSGSRPSSGEERAGFTRRRDKAALSAAMLGSPAAALLLVSVGFSAAHGGCVIDSKAPIHFVGAVTFAISVVCTILARRYWQRTGRDWRTDVPGPLGRARMMAGVGLLNGALFIPLIIVAWAVTAFFLPCQGT